MLCWAHFGDVHASDEDGWTSVRDLAALVADVGNAGEGAVDFAYLPGDIANHGTAEQYARVREAMAGLRLPWFAVPGDHDFEPRSLDAYRAGLGARDLPACAMMNGRRCLFLDIVSAGNGGSDFRLGAAQTAWLRDHLERSRQDDAPPLVFMHAFPGDLTEHADAIGRLFAEFDVVGVDTGHTHYNEMLNDGAVIYTATRSTGQVEEGPVGYSLHAAFGSVVSTRFKALSDPWPFVLIGSPADERAVTHPARRDQVPGASFTVCAKVFGPDIRTVELTVDDRPPLTMARGPACTWAGAAGGLDDGTHRLSVEAVGGDGVLDRDTVTVRVSHEPVSERPLLREHPGDHRHSIGAWPERGLLGTQLGPNRNGRKW